MNLPTEKYFELEITPRLEDYEAILSRLEPPVAEIVITEITKVLMEKISTQLDLWEIEMGVLGPKTIFIQGVCLWKHEEGKEWVEKCYREKIFRRCDSRLLFFHREGDSYSVRAFYFSNGKFTGTESIGSFSMVYIIRNVNLEEEWILPNLRKGLDPLGGSAFDEFCKKRRLDFFPEHEYAGLVEHLLVYTLAGEYGDKPEYRELEAQGKIPYDYLDSARVYLKYQDILEIIKE